MAIKATITLEIPRFNASFAKWQLLRPLRSQPVTIGGLPWQIMVSWHEDSALGVFVECAGGGGGAKDRHRAWQCAANVVLRVKSQKPRRASLQRIIFHSFTSTRNTFGYRQFVFYEELIDRSRGFLLNDTLFVEADIKISDVIANVIGAKLAEKSAVDALKLDNLHENLKAKEAEIAKLVKLAQSGAVSALRAENLSACLDAKSKEIDEITKNCAQINAKLTENKAKLAESEAKLPKIESRIAQNAAKLAQTEAKLAQCESDLVQTEIKLAQNEASLARITALRASDAAKYQKEINALGALLARFEELELQSDLWLP